MYTEIYDLLNGASILLHAAGVVVYGWGGGGGAVLEELHVFAYGCVLPVEETCNHTREKLAYSLIA